MLGENTVNARLDPRPHGRWAWYQLFAHAPHINPQKLGLWITSYMLSKRMTSQRTDGLKELRL